MKAHKRSLNPGAMMIAILLILAGIVIAVLAVMDFASLGIFWGTVTLVGGVTTSCIAITAIVTGKQEWILLDLITTP